MSVILALALGLAAVAVGLALCHREIRALRRAIAALDEGNGRRAAAIVAGLQSLREPLEAVRAGVEELSPNRRETVEQRAPTATAPEPTGLRLDLPRATDDERDSEGETRLVRQPTAAELLAAGAVRPASGRRRITPRSVLGAVCRMCEGGGMVRARSSALESCSGCGGSGYIDPEDEIAPTSDERKAQLPG